ncbi:MAG: ABC transporter ATP-binding protein [Alphaproteobacteria bacterium]|nr:ABC transporter ATP-binding protein [Alphaproteobacteria bacterium]
MTANAGGDDRFLAVDDLVIAYGPVTAVDRVSFAVRRGEHVTLLGPSGCGKTTTLRAVAGLETPRSGRIAIDGTAVFDGAAGRNLPPERRGLSMVFQSYAIWPHMTVFDNVAFGFRARGVARAASRAPVERALAMVDLAAYAERPATRLSGGQQQRVALARAIAFDPKVILLDEPLSNLDAQLRISMRTELKDLQKRLGFTSIYVTHDQEEAFALSDRIIVMRAGIIEQQGTPEEIHAAPRTRFVANFLGVKNILDAEVAPLRDAAGMAEARVAPDVVLPARDPRRGEGRAPSAVCFRPINVRLAPDRGGDQPGIAGVVSRYIFIGDLVHYFVRSGAVEICAYGLPDPALAEGRAVRWQVDPEHCLVLRD